MSLALRNAGLVLALLMGAGTGHAQQRSEPPSPTGVALRQSALLTSARKSYALVIGIDTYSSGWPALTSAVRDARDVAETLTAQGFDVRLEKNLTAAALRSAVDEFFITAGSDPEARLLFWFAGHGHTIEQIHTGKQTGYIVAADAVNPNAVPPGLKQSSEIDFRRRSIAIEDITAQMRRADARHILLVFDSCFSGTAFSGTRSGVIPPSVEAYAGNPARQLITSGTKGQEVSDDGRFRDLFIRAITGSAISADANRDGFVTGTELGNFLVAGLMNATGAQQTPVFGALREGYEIGDFVFVLPWKAEQLAKSSESKPDERPSAPTEEMEKFWTFVREQRNKALIERYLETFPNTPFRSVALDELRQLSTETTVAVAPADPTKQGASTTTGPVKTPGPNAIPSTSPPTDPWSVVRIDFATTRQAEPASDGSLRFGAQRASELTFGKAEITIPKTHVVGVIERPTSFDLVVGSLMIQSQDPKKHVTLKSTARLTRQEFSTAAREQHSLSRKSDALVYVHGYNTRFDQALFRAAQLAYDMSHEGPVYVFSWASAGSISAYVADRAAAQASEPLFGQFLEIVGNEIGQGAINIVAHAQGSELVLSALKSIAARTAAGAPRIGQVVFAAPDIDVDVFNADCKDVKRLSRGVTVYASQADRALSAARSLSGRDRAGQIGAAGPVINLDCADVIDTSSVTSDTFNLGHSGYAEKSALLNDLATALRGAGPPAARSAAMRAVSTPKGTYWRLSN